MLYDHKSTIVFVLRPTPQRVTFDPPCKQSDYGQFRLPGGYEIRGRDMAGSRDAR